MLFKETEDRGQDWTYTITVSVMEIYNEMIRSASYQQFNSRFPSICDKIYVDAYILLSTNLIQEFC